MRVVVSLLIRGGISDKKGKRILIIFFVIVGCSAPLIAIEEGVLEKTATNILVAGFSVFYFAFVIGRLRNL